LVALCRFAEIIALRRDAVMFFPQWQIALSETGQCVLFEKSHGTAGHD
jgi:hypothetical protein